MSGLGHVVLNITMIFITIFILEKKPPPQSFTQTKNQRPERACLRPVGGELVSRTIIYVFCMGWHPPLGLGVAPSGSAKHGMYDQLAKPA